MQKGVAPSENSGSGVGYWRPANKTGRNEVVLISDPETIMSGEFVKLWKQNGFGGASYPLNASWEYLGKSDPKNTLCPNEKPQYAAGVWVAYEEDGAWKPGLWIVSKSVHSAIINMFEDSPAKGGVINIMMQNKHWTVSYVSKKTAPAAALDVELPDDEVTERLMGSYEDADSVWEMLRNRLEVSSNEEVMELFGVGVGDDLL